MVRNGGGGGSKQHRVFQGRSGFVEEEDEGGREGGREREGREEGGWEGGREEENAGVWGLGNGGWLRSFPRRDSLKRASQRKASRKGLALEREVGRGVGKKKKTPNINQPASSSLSTSLTPPLSPPPPLPPSLFCPQVLPCNGAGEGESGRRGTQNGCC